ncbi:MAG: hypothetical protein IIA75_08565, partial [Proteobacteria bacterium]|nr:hypothetical protein [Pseudomonadota bacterium]
MFEEQKSQFDPGDPRTTLSVRQHEVSPSACCSSVFADLMQTMEVLDEKLTDPDFWRKRNRCKEQAPRNAVLINAKVLTMDESFSEASAMAIKDGKIVAVGD